MPYTILDGNITRTMAAYCASPAGGQVLFEASSAAISSLLTGTVLGALSNPSNSGVSLCIHRIYIGGAQAGSITQTRNATVTGGSTITPDNRGGGANAAKATFKASPALSGGSTLKVSFVSTSFFEEVEEAGALIVPPGGTLAWTYTPTVAGNGTVDVVWYEL